MVLNTCIGRKYLFKEVQSVLDFFPSISCQIYRSREIYFIDIRPGTTGKALSLGSLTFYILSSISPITL